MHLLELVKIEEKQSCDLSKFLEYYEHLEGADRFVPMAEADAVKVLTVHKAKGLEFPVVIVPFLEMDIKAGSGGRDGSQAYMMDIQEDGLRLIRLKESYRQFSPELQAMYEKEYKKAFLVELNSAYVALTRAIEELYIFVPGRVGNAVNAARFLIPEDCLGLGTLADRPLAHEVPEVHRKIGPFISEAWGHLQEEFLNQPEKSALLARRGEFYHAVLMHIGIVNDENAVQTVEKAFEKASLLFPPRCPARGGACGELHGGGNDVLIHIHHFITRDDVRPFFYLPLDANVFCEKEFVNSLGDTKRIDRLVVLKDEVWIVDYKLFPGLAEEHQKQIRDYVTLVRQFYPKRKVSGQVLYIMPE